MGISWLPDAPIGHNFTDDTMPSPVFLVDSDNEDGIEIDAESLINQDGYQLLGDREDIADSGETSDEEVSILGIHHFSVFTLTR